jgi:DNA-binding XRE family transcriptional regulator
MNVRLLKAKRIERDIRQSEVAHYLGITPKSACEKENSQRCRYTVEEMLKLSEYLKMSLKEFDAIFFDGKLTVCTKNEHDKYP